MGYCKDPVGLGVLALIGRTASALGGARGIRAEAVQILAFHTDTRERSGFFSLSHSPPLSLSAFIELLAPSLNSRDPSMLPRSRNGRSSTGFFFVASALALSRTSSRTRPPCGLRSPARLQRIYYVPSGSHRFLADSVGNGTTGTTSIPIETTLRISYSGSVESIWTLNVENFDVRTFYHACYTCKIFWNSIDNETRLPLLSWYNLKAVGKCLFEYLDLLIQRIITLFKYFRDFRQIYIYTNYLINFRYTRPIWSFTYSISIKSIYKYTNSFVSNCHIVLKTMVLA